MANITHVPNEANIMAPSLVQECNELLVADMLANGPVRVLAYSANSTPRPSPVYANFDNASDDLIGEATVGAVTVVGQDIVMSNITDILNVGASEKADIYEVRSTIGDKLYFRIKGTGTRVNTNEILRINSLTVNNNNTPTFPQADLFPDSSPYPIQFRIELPLWAVPNAYMDHHRDSNLLMFLGDAGGGLYDDLYLKFPQTKRVWNIGERDYYNNSGGEFGSSEFLTIDGEFTNNNRTFEFSVMTTDPFFGAEQTGAISSSPGGFKFTFTTTHMLKYNPYGDTSLIPSFVNDDILVYRKKNTEQAFTLMPVYKSQNYAYVSRYGAYQMARWWDFGVLLQ